MAFLQEWVPQPKSTANFKQTIFEFEAKDVHPLDHMDLHRKIGDMFYSTFTHTALTSSKLHLSLKNVKSQLKLEKISSLTKDNIIKYLEEMVIIKKNNFDIESMRNQLKLTTTKDPQEKELGETEIQK